MSQEELIPVNIIVADRSYRLKIKPEEEAAVRKVMKEANEQILQFKTNYAGKDMQDYIAMALIMYASQTAVDNSSPALSADVARQLGELNDLLEEALK